MVSGTTSDAKPRSSRSITVRHTPATLTLSSIERRSSTRAHAISSREPDFVGLTWRTVPSSSTMPVNTLKVSFDRDVLAEATDAHVLQLGGIGDSRECGRSIAAGDRRADDHESIREAPAHEGAGHARSGFGQHGVHAVFAEPAHRRAEVEAAVGAWQRREQHACLAELVRAPGIGVARDEQHRVL